MNKPKLYIKKENGRYEEYREPQRPHEDNALYRRYGKKYVPAEMCLSGEWSWQEGVFAITRTPGSMKPNHWASADYLQKIFTMYKCGDIENVSIGKLAGMEKLAEHLTHHWYDIKGVNPYEKAASIVAILMNYEENQERK